MKMYIAAAVILLSAACSPNDHENSLPTREDVDRLEQQLANHPCVGALGDWERNYRFSRKTGLFSSHTFYPDFGVIEFHLRKGGTIEISPGRKIMPQRPDGDWPDSSPIQSVDGRFTLSSNSLRLAPCRPLE